MSAEKVALEAALYYSKRLETRILELTDEVKECRMRNENLRRQVRDVKDALKDKDSTGPMCESSMPQEMAAQCADAPAYSARCPACGRSR